MSEPTVQFTNAIPGSGKTYGRGVRYLVEEWLPYQKGDFWSNYPLRVDAIVEYMGKRFPKLDPEEIRSRIKFFPDDVVKSWRHQESTVAEFFEDKDIRGAHIAIDEVHKFVNRDSPKGIVQKWQDWLGELRHDGATCEFLSQHEMKVHKSIRDHAGLQRFMFNTERKPDPFFGVLMEYWYELRAGFITGEYRSKVVEAVKQDSMGKLVLSPELGRTYVLDPELFPLYDSYSQRDGSAGKGGGRQHVFQTETKTGLLWWFFRHNWHKVGPRLLILFAAIWICFFGGMTVCMNGFMALMKSMAPGGDKNKPAQELANIPANTAILASQADASGATPSPAPVQNNGSSLFNQPATGKTNPKGPDTAADLVAKLQAEIVARDKTIEQMKADGARFAEVVALFGDQITLRCGVTVEINEQIPLGPLKGRTVKGISHAKRRVILDDGTVLPLSP